MPRAHQPCLNRLYITLKNVYMWIFRILVRYVLDYNCIYLIWNAMELVYCDVGLYSPYKKGPQGVEKTDEGPRQ